MCFIQGLLYVQKKSCFDGREWNCLEGSYANYTTIATPRAPAHRKFYHLFNNFCGGNVQLNYVYSTKEHVLKDEGKGRSIPSIPPFPKGKFRK